MPWKNLRLFLLDRRIEPDSVRRQVEELRFAGEEGIVGSEVFDEFRELRLHYVFKLPKYVRISKLEEGGLTEDRIKVESYAEVELHLHENGLIEAYGSPMLIERAINALSMLGEIDPVVFGQKDFQRVMKMATDIRRVKIYGTEDEHVVEVVLLGGGLAASTELKRLRRGGKLREVSGKLELPEGTYGFSMNENSIRFFIKDPEQAQKDLEFFIESLLSEA